MKQKNNKEYGQGKRLHILSEKEYGEIYSMPKFDKEDRINYFELNYFELEKVNHIKSFDAKILFILQLGYFKAKFQFYVFKLKDIPEDIKFITNKYFEGKSINNLDFASNLKVGNSQRKEILDLLGFNFYEPDKKIESFLVQLCEIDLNPKFIQYKAYINISEN